ncbi:hypothetical protein P152DRAFT_517829 [Eremomyces bilateralis CBS 781.70]|uniref:Uncharacterized protein n=1 Tax=Eremomyces bilateralis CBS 781.70 TaxID=1392243 RepID=A0A6G1FQH0_9PEZI|nr:uncharacterized protein P152DRAFT_517829 [Eremomyces bilateralis CBS 781.70]KAF1808044.1 hypothetical protein P152DRAFT_517829 [Eremomyces bilateralis CBS 781.70]
MTGNEIVGDVVMEPVATVVVEDTVPLYRGRGLVEVQKMETPLGTATVLCCSRRGCDRHVVVLGPGYSVEETRSSKTKTGKVIVAPDSWCASCLTPEKPWSENPWRGTAGLFPLVSQSMLQRVAAYLGEPDVVRSTDEVPLYSQYMTWCMAEGFRFHRLTEGGLVPAWWDDVVQLSPLSLFGPAVTGKSEMEVLVSWDLRLDDDDVADGTDVSDTVTVGGRLRERMDSVLNTCLVALDWFH